MGKRETFRDKMRLAATCAVVLLHTITGVTDTTDMSLYPTEERVFSALLDLVCWCVPVFLMISGYLFLNPERKIGMGKMVTRYCRRIVLALFLFGVPYACMEEIAVEGSFRIGMAGEAFLRVVRGESWSHMWYLYLVLFLYFITPPVKWLLARVPRWTVHGLQFVLFVGCAILPCLYRITGWEEIPTLPYDGIYFFYYVCGYLFVTGEKKRLEWAVGRGAVPVLAVLLAAAMAAMRLFGYEMRMAYNYPLTVLLSLLLFGWGAGADKGEKKKESRGAAFLERAAALGFTVYLIHPLFLNLAYKYFHVTLLSFPLGLSLPIFFLGTLLLSVAGAWVLQRIPPLRKYVL